MAKEGIRKHDQQETERLVNNVQHLTTGRDNMNILSEKQGKAKQSLK